MHEQKPEARTKTRQRFGGALRLSAKIIMVGFIVTVVASWDSSHARSVQPPGPANRCDLSFNTQRYNNKTKLVSQVLDRNIIAPVDFTVQQWARVFSDQDLGLSKRQIVQEINANDVYQRHILGGVLTSTLQPDDWVAMTSPTQCDALAGELQTARNTAALYSTANTLGAGYMRGGNYLGGIGVHYQNLGLITDTFRPDRPAQILYDGTGPNAAVVGLSYAVLSSASTPPEGFTGKNDRWFRHDHWCLDPANGNRLIAANVLSQQECEGRGGNHVMNPGWWTLHVWVVPGCESDWGIFSVSNPNLPYMPAGATRTPGCGLDKPVTDRLNFDKRGTGPEIN